MVDSIGEIIGIVDPRALKAIKKLGEYRDPQSFNTLISVIETEMGTDSPAWEEAVLALGKYQDREGVGLDQYKPHLDRLDQLTTEHDAKMKDGDVLMLTAVHRALSKTG